MKSTGHDIHFLSRLTERSDDATTERALRLYRDPELVRAILADAPEVPRESTGAAKVSLGERLRLAGIVPAPDPEERIAIALAEGDSPPTVIVSRNGHFVTCLGAGMRVSTGRMVAWELAEQHFILDDASDAYEAIQRESRLDQMMKNIYFAGFRMTREAFLDFRKVAPLIWTAWRDHTVSCNTAFVQLLVKLAVVRKLREDDPDCQNFWRKYHAVAHLFMLSTLGGQDSHDYWFHQTPDGDMPFFQAFFIPFIAFNEYSFMARALWYVGQGGKHLMARAKTALSAADHWTNWRAAALCMLVLGAHHRKLAPDVRRYLRQVPAPGESEFSGVHAHAETIRDMANWAMRREDELSEHEVNGFRAWAGDWCLRDRNHKMASFVDANGLTSLDFARCLLVNIEHDTRSLEDLTMLMRALPFIVSMRAEDFFHPVAAASIVEKGYDFSIVARFCGHFRTENKPVRVENKLGRNDPCHCGSGKKLKKCCKGSEGKGD